MYDSRQLLVAREPYKEFEMINAENGILDRKLKGSSGGSRPFLDREGLSLFTVGLNETGTPSLKDFKKAIRTWNLLTGFLETEIPLTTDLRTFSVNPETNLLAIFDTARIAILNTESLHPIQVLATPGRLVTTLEFADERLIFMLEAIMQNSLDLILSQAKKINISIASRALFLELYYLLMNHKWLRAAFEVASLSGTSIAACPWSVSQPTTIPTQAQRRKCREGLEIGLVP